jgi:hypothetical protein
MLVPAQVDFKGDVVDGVRVRPAPAQKSAPSAAETEPPFDDDDPNFQI